MAISRPFLLAVLGALLLGVTVLAVQSARTDSDAAPAALQTEPAPSTGKTTEVAGPDATLRSAFDLGEVDSGRFDARVSFQAPRAVGVRFRIAGAFDASAAGAIPSFDVGARIGVGGKAIAGGFVSLGDRAYFTRGDTGWRVPASVWQPLADSAAKGGKQQQLPLSIHPETWVRDVKSEGTQRIDGVEVEHVSATIDPKAVVNDLSQAVRQNGGTLPDADTVSRAVKHAELDVWVGSDDHILRRLLLDVGFGRGRGIDADLRLSDVNEQQRIEAPANVRAGAPEGTFGQFANGVVGGINGVTGTPSASLEALASPNPRRAARAVRDHKKVVILFRNERGLDDRAMTSVLRDVDRRTKALILSDPVGAVERYGKLVEDLGVSQTPSVVIIDRTGKAQLLEGYVDSDTLTQAVSDAR